uniref:Interleukin-1 receptor type 1 n=1 Tax=Callorhinchus milii TaxID=7868 RepID=V9KDX3_CALMI
MNDTADTWTNELCIDKGIYFERSFVLEREGVLLHCPMNLYIEWNESINVKYNYSFMWYNNKTAEIIKTEEKQRIHMKNEFLWFLPVLLEDTSIYYCVLRNSTYCIKVAVSLTVTKSADTSCFRDTKAYGVTSHFGNSKQMRCPDLEYYENPEEVLEIKWYKVCNPILDRSKYIKDHFDLIIINVTKSDAGIYVCELHFLHNGAKYVKAKTINMEVKGCSSALRPKIVQPSNNTIELQPGSNLNLSCIAFTGHCDPPVTIVYWAVNNTYIENYFNYSIQFGNGKHQDEIQGNYFEAYVFFPEFKEEYYDLLLVCYAMNGLGTEIANVRIIKSPPSFQKEIIAVFAVLASVLLISVCTYTFFKIDIVLWYRDINLGDYHENDDKIYDAFVIYPKSSSSLDNTSIFVTEFLPQVLENQCGYKVFIPGRDDLPGGAFVETVEENIKASRRLIFVLTKSSGKQLENTFEQQIGLHDALISNRIKVILIELEQIKDCSEFTESMRHVIRKEGTIKWKETEWKNKSPSLNSRFWKRVRYNMPPRSSRLLEGS